MALNRRQQLQLDRMGDTQYDSLFWGTAAPLTPYMPGEEVNDSGQRLRYPGSGPETFTRNGTEYTRGYGSGYFTGPNAWMLPYMISDPEFGDAIPSSIVPQYQAVSGNSFLDRFAPAIGMGLMGLPLAASLGSIGGLANSFNLPVGMTGAEIQGIADSLFPTLGAGGSTLPESYWSMVAGEAPAATGEALSAALGGGGFQSGMADLAASFGAEGFAPAAGGMGASSLMNLFDPNADYDEYLSGNYGTPAAVAPGVSQATGNLWPALSAAGTGASLLKGNSNAEQTAGLLKQLGLDISPAALGMLGTGLSTALGAYGANQQANSLQKIADQSRADRQPFLNDALDMLQNPNKFYERPEVTGAIDASLRGLSAKVGNPINNPGALAQQAAFNLGMYNNALTSRANLGLSGQDTTSRLQTNAALANNGLYNALGSGLGSMLSTTPNLNTVLADYFTRQL